MAIKNVEEKIKKAASKTPSKWKESAKWRKENRAWLNKSFEIALKILDALEEKGWKQKDLAAKMEVTPQQVSKILKGKENLSLSTITKLEEVLMVKLIAIPSFESRVEFELVDTDVLEFLNAIDVGYFDNISLEELKGTEFVSEDEDPDYDPDGNNEELSLSNLSIAA